MIEKNCIKSEHKQNRVNQHNYHTLFKFTKFQITRDPSYVSKGNIGDALAEEIMNSRRVELWGEGFRFYDLKRLHMSIKRGSNFDIAFCTFLEKDKDAQGWVWEIPKIETDFNSLCTKNY